jgi:Leucine-rich repeat (LRR) protein
LYPQLHSVNVANNRLKRLPYSTWRSSVLRELNASNNQISDLQAAAPRARDVGRQSRNPYIAAAEGARRAIGKRGEAPNISTQLPVEETAKSSRKSSVPVTKVDVLR